MNIAIDLTLRCDLKCPNCDRFCNNEPLLGMKRTDTDLSEVHLKILENEIRKKEKGFVHKLEILGGEPMLSPIFDNTATLAKTLKDEGYIKQLHIISNRTQKIKNEKTHPFLKFFKERVKVQDKAKKHKCVFVCPEDENEKGNICKIPTRCGINFNCYGFTLGGHCSTVLEFFQIEKYYIYHLPDSIAEFKIMGPIESELCSKCAYGINCGRNHKNKNEGEVIGKTYQKQIEINKLKYTSPDMTWIDRYVFE